MMRLRATVVAMFDVLALTDDQWRAIQIVVFVSIVGFMGIVTILNLGERWRK